ncbi:Crp/Fnr family transcriptional regulator [Clostridium tunisiense]|uniref:Crp/Fnr family transcriptional regulator n=1 Tax=Clostridium tunisiense TaxID=219748 RepID=UPI0002DFEFEE|nr:Crp/Fnr family transcriptional regulator [Clostridium tunisiense]
MKIKISELKKLELFQQVKEETILELVNKCNVVKLQKGEVLFLERDEVNNIYIILEGKVTMYRTTSDGQKRIIYVLTHGTIINEAIFDGITASICCEGYENTQLISINKEDILKIMEKDFQFTKIIINSMSKKIRRLYRQLKNTAVIRVDKKVAAKLWKLSMDYGKPYDDETIIDLKITITYLAEMLGHPRETISRALKTLEGQGLVKYLDKKFIVNQQKLIEYYRNL